MSEFEVVKAFNTVNRRLAVGAVLTASDEIAPFTFAEREERGFIRPRGSANEPAVAQPSPRRPLPSKSPAALADADAG